MKKEDDKSREVTQRDTFAVTQKAVLYNPENRKFLILKDSANDGGGSVKVLGEWQLAGGHIDFVDTDSPSALKREIAEELGKKIKYEIGDLFYATRGDYSGYKRVMNCYLVRYISGEIALSEEHTEYVWETKEEIDANEEYFDILKEIVSRASERIEELEAHDKMLRTLADFDNYKKRSGEQQKDFAKYASERVIMDMLPVLDNFHAATSFVPDDQKDSPWLTGIMFIQQQMEKVFEDADVKVIEIKVGDHFDAKTMEAITSKKASDDDKEEEGETDAKESHEVTKVLQKGYMIGDRVMRVARVEIN